VVREYVTVHRSKETDGETLVGNDCYLMAYSHLGHDCRIGDGVIMVNGANLAGHVTVENGVFVSALAAIHQFVRVGRLSLVGGLSPIRKDILPYTILEGHPPRVRGLNRVGLKRAGFSVEVRSAIKQAMNVLLDKGCRADEAVNRIREKHGDIQEISHLAEFAEQSERGFYR
jgi:UDP-N-acetylglucosamine acyltransferase